ncbi:hypothetical protein [[Pseudomonas] boreopolis]|uniref:hypothetical protein n=1 Tax=Xanthomonas boreopolis TaxID=86183 RepID=UPI0032DCA796
MSKLTVITDRALERALELASSAGDGLKHAGSSLRHAAPHASEWLKTGAAIGAVKTGGRVAGKFVRRNPAIAVAAAVAGVGLIGYALYRKRKQREQEQGVIEGSAERLNGNAGNTTARRAARANRRFATTPTDGAE